MKLNLKENIKDTLEEWRKYFITDLKIKNLSQNTLKIYNLVLNEFIEYVFIENENSTEPLKMQDLNKYFMSSFIYSLQERGLNQNTLILYLKVIKSFFRFISFENEEAIDILAPIENLKIKSKLKEPEYFTVEEFEKIKTALQEEMDKCNKYFRYKNLFALYMLLSTGARANEIISIKLEDIKIEKNEISFQIKRKGGKDDVIYLLEEDKHYLEKLLELKDFKSPYLFSTKNGKISYRTLYDFNKRFLKKIGIFNSKKHKLHIYRHSFARLLVKQNINLQTIKELLGHSDIAITSKYYARADEKDKKNALKTIKRSLK